MTGRFTYNEIVRPVIALVTKSCTDCGDVNTRVEFYRSAGNYVQYTKINSRRRRDPCT